MDYLVCYDILEPKDDSEYDRRDRSVIGVLRTLNGCHVQDSVWRVQGYTQGQIIDALNRVIHAQDRVAIVLIGATPFFYRPLEDC